MSSIPDATIDACHEAYIAEVQSWRIIGPLIERGSSLSRKQREYYQAVRDGMFAADVKPNAPIDVSQDTVEHLHFREKGYAIDFLRWRGTRAAIEKYSELLQRVLVEGAVDTSSTDRG